MKWQQISDNWPAFYEAILDKWPEAEEADLDEIEGDQRAFLRYIARINEIEPEEAREDIREWLASEIPSDVLLDEAGGMGAMDDDDDLPVISDEDEG